MKCKILLNLPPSVFSQIIGRLFEIRQVRLEKWYFFLMDIFNGKTSSMKTIIFHQKPHSYRHFITEPNMNTYYVTANIDPFKHMDMVDYSAYFILSDRQEKQKLKHIH